MSTDAAYATAESVARRSYGRLLALLAKRSNDVVGAEDALADAFTTALAAWPFQGVPKNPEAWLLTAARRRVVDGARHAKTVAGLHPHLALLHDESSEAREAGMPDERLALMFACAHPSLDESVRAPLILQTVLGFDATTIASAFLVSPAAMAQRLTRAKTKIRHARIPFEIPDEAERPQRLDAVLASIYAAFAEGWSDPVAAEPRRRSLGDEAIWLGRLVIGLLPTAPEAKGLLALMLYAEARRMARRTACGRFVPLDEQDVGRWNVEMIDEAEVLLQAASLSAAPGRYQIEAAIQSAHAVRRMCGRADWHAIARLYDTLSAMTDSPVVRLNRAAAIAETEGPDAALRELEGIAADERLARYQPFWATRAALCARAGRPEEARDAYRRAIGLESDGAVRNFLETRLNSLG